MRAFSFGLLLLVSMVTGAFTQNVQLAPIPTPFPFPAGSTVFQWDYQCIPQRACGLSGFGLDRQNLKSATVVLANIKFGENEMRTYFVWGVLIDGSTIVGMTQDEFSFRFFAINMRLIAAGSPGL